MDLKQLFQDALETPQLSNLPQIPKPKLDIDKLPSPTAPTEGGSEASMLVYLLVCPSHTTTNQIWNASWHSCIWNDTWYLHLVADADHVSQTHASLALILK